MWFEGVQNVVLSSKVFKHLVHIFSISKLRFWAFGSDSKIRYFSDLQGKNGDRDPERLSKNPQKMDFTFCDRVFRSNK